MDRRQFCVRKELFGFNLDSKNPDTESELSFVLQKPGVGERQKASEDNAAVP